MSLPGRAKQILLYPTALSAHSAQNLYLHVFATLGHRAQRTLNQTAYSPIVISQRGLPTPAWRFTYPAMAVHPMYRSCHWSQRDILFNKPTATYKSWDHSIVIGTKCTGLEPQSQSPKNAETGDDTEHYAPCSNRIDLVSVVDLGRRGQHRL